MTKRYMPPINLRRPKGVHAAFRMEADPNPEDQMREVSAAIKKITDDLKSFAETAQKEIKANGDVSAEIKAKTDEALAKHSELEGRLGEIEQKLSRRAGEPEARRTAGQEVIENEDVQAFMAKKPGKSSVKVPIKAAITSDGASAGDAVPPDRRPGIVTPAQRRMRIRQLLAPGSTSSNSVEYVQETGFTNSAAPVAENTLKAESDLTFELVNTPVRTIAHWVHATKQILDDAPMLQSYIDGRLRFGLEFVEEEQLLTGDGTGQNLHGLVPQATAYDRGWDGTKIDTIRLAILQAFLAEYPPDGIVLNPIDWADIELTKDTQGRYIFANPQGMAGPVLWGRPVVETQAMVEDEFLVGAFGLAAQLFDRMEATVEISTEDRDNFVKNMVTVLAEERLALAVYRPEALVHGPFTEPV